MLSLLLFTVVAPAMMVQAASTPVFATLSGPTLVAINEKHQYQVVAIGGPGEGTGGNYSFQLHLDWQLQDGWQGPARLGWIEDRQVLCQRDGLQLR